MNRRAKRKLKMSSNNSNSKKKDFEQSEEIMLDTIITEVSESQEVDSYSYSRGHSITPRGYIESSTGLTMPGGHGHSSVTINTNSGSTTLQNNSHNSLGLNSGQAVSQHQHSQFRLNQQQGYLDGSTGNNTMVTEGRFDASAGVDMANSNSGTGSHTKINRSSRGGYSTVEVGSGGGGRMGFSMGSGGGDGRGVAVAGGSRMAMGLGSGGGARGEDSVVRNVTTRTTTVSTSGGNMVNAPEPAILTGEESYVLGGVGRGGNRVEVVSGMSQVVSGGTIATNSSPVNRGGSGVRGAGSRGINVVSGRNMASMGSGRMSGHGSGSQGGDINTLQVADHQTGAGNGMAIGLSGSGAQLTAGHQEFIGMDSGGLEVNQTTVNRVGGGGGGAQGGSIGHEMMTESLIQETTSSLHSSSMRTSNVVTSSTITRGAAGNSRVYQNSAGQANINSNINVIDQVDLQQMDAGASGEDEDIEIMVVEETSGGGVIHSKASSGRKSSNNNNSGRFGYGSSSSSATNSTKRTGGYGYSGSSSGRGGRGKGNLTTAQRLPKEMFIRNSVGGGGGGGYGRTDQKGGSNKGGVLDVAGAQNTTTTTTTTTIVTSSHGEGGNGDSKAQRRRDIHQEVIQEERNLMTSQELEQGIDAEELDDQDGGSRGSGYGGRDTRYSGYSGKNMAGFSNTSPTRKKRRRKSSQKGLKEKIDQRKEMRKSIKNQAVQDASNQRSSTNSFRATQKTTSEVSGSFVSRTEQRNIRGSRYPRDNKKMEKAIVKRLSSRSRSKQSRKDRPRHATGTTSNLTQSGGHAVGYSYRMHRDSEDLIQSNIVNTSADMKDHQMLYGFLGGEAGSTAKKGGRNTNGSRKNVNPSLDGSISGFSRTKRVVMMEGDRASQRETVTAMDDSSEVRLSYNSNSVSQSGKKGFGGPGSRNRQKQGKAGSGYPYGKQGKYYDSPGKQGKPREDEGSDMKKRVNYSQKSAAKFIREESKRLSGRVAGRYAPERTSFEQDPSLNSFNQYNVNGGGNGGNLGGRGPGGYRDRGDPKGTTVANSLSNRKSMIERGVERSARTGGQVRGGSRASFSQKKRRAYKVITDINFIEAVKIIESPNAPIASNQNYNSNEINAISSIKINRFRNNCTLLFKLDLFVDKALKSRCHHFLRQLKLNKHGLLKEEDPRAKKLFNFKFVKNLNKLRKITKKRAILRWKVKADSFLQNQCIKRFVIAARINYAVAIYRMRWILERDAMLRRQEERDNYYNNIDDFVGRAEKIRREVYSNKNQLEYVFCRLKNQYLFGKKVDRLAGLCGRLLRQEREVVGGFGALRRTARTKEWLVRGLVRRLVLNQRIGLERLRDWRMRCIRDRLKTLGDPALINSLKILQNKAKSNLNRALSTNPDYEDGLIKLQRLFNLKKGRIKHKVVDHISFRIPALEHLKSEKLKNLEAIAQRIQKYNLEKLRNHNRTLKTQILARVLNEAHNRYLKKMRETLAKLSGTDPTEYEYKHFANFIHELVNGNLKNDLLASFWKLKQWYLNSQDRVDEGARKLGDLENLFNRQKKMTINSMVDYIIYLSELEDNLNRLSYSVDKTLHLVLLKQAWRALRAKLDFERLKDKKRNFLAKKLVYAQQLKQNDAIRRLVLDCLCTDGWSHVENDAVFTPYTDDIRFKGGRELIDLSNHMQGQSNQQEKLTQAYKLAFILRRLRRKKVYDGFSQINAYNKFVLKQLYFKQVYRWEEVTDQMEYLRELKRVKKSINLLLAVKSAIRSASEDTLRVAFVRTKMEGYRREGYRRKEVGLQVIVDLFEGKRENEVKNAFTWMKVFVLEAKRRAERSFARAPSGSVFSGIVAGYSRQRRLARKRDRFVRALKEAKKEVHGGGAQELVERAA